MGTQLFKTNVPIELIWNFIKLIAEEKDATFILNKIVYKQAEYRKMAPYCPAGMVALR